MVNVGDIVIAISSGNFHSESPEPHPLLPYKVEERLSLTNNLGYPVTSTTTSSSIFNIYRVKSIDLNCTDRSYIGGLNYEQTQDVIIETVDGKKVYLEDDYWQYVSSYELLKIIAELLRLNPDIIIKL